MLDLDGDGVETYELNGEQKIYFDHEGDGFAELTGWVSKDDGLLVRDLNGDDQITSGSELFGNQTFLSSGQKAANAFEALKEFDNNNDGQIDANDSIFTQLKVWKDSNTNGKVDSGELLTLTQANVKSISTQYEESIKYNDTVVYNPYTQQYVVNSGVYDDYWRNTKDASSNEHRQVGSYITTDGVQHNATDVWFKTNPQESQALSPVTVPDDIAQLPNFLGRGKVRSLHETMAMDTSGKLKALVIAFANENNAVKRDELFLDILYRWTGVQDIDPKSRDNFLYYIPGMDARKLEALEALWGHDFLGTWCWGQQDRNPNRNAWPVLLSEFNAIEMSFKTFLMQQTHYNEWNTHIVYDWNDDAFTYLGNCSYLIDQINIIVDQNKGNNSAIEKSVNEIVAWFKGNKLYNSVDYRQLSEKLKAMHDEGLNVSTSLFEDGGNLFFTDESNKTYYFQNATTVMGGIGDEKFGLTASNSLINGGSGNDSIVLAGDESNIIFGIGSGEDVVYGLDFYILLKDGLAANDIEYKTVNGDGISKDLVIKVKNTNDSIKVKNYLYSYIKPQITLFFQDEVSWGNEEIESFLFMQDNSGNDFFIGFNRLDDTMYGGNGNDVIYGLAGKDVLYGGTGNNWIDGGVGSDTYYCGEGTDTIDEFYSDNNSINTLVFLDSYIQDINFRFTVDESLKINLINGNSVLINSFGTWLREEKGFNFSFSDSQITNYADIEKLALMDSGKDDVIVSLYNDDTIDAGYGNDYFINKFGNDIYSFGISDGNDTIQSDSGAIKFKEGVTANDVVWSLDGSDLVLSLSSSGDSLRIKNWISQYVDINSYQFSDGVVLSKLDINQKLNLSSNEEILYGGVNADSLNGANLNSTIYGGEGNDTLDGGGGNDLIYGEQGDDVLIGGMDRDILIGGQGNNIFIFNKGSGLDTVVSTNGANDTIKFGAGIKPEDITVQFGHQLFSPDNILAPGALGYTDLVVGFGGNDAIVLSADANDIGLASVQHFEFENGTVWTMADIVARADEGRFDGGHSSVKVGTQADDLIYGANGNQSNIVQSLANNDKIYLGDGFDYVLAGTGDDVIDAGAGDDLIAGGEGNDRANADDGDDVIVFNYGEGDDTVIAGKGNDAISFGVTITPQMLSIALDKNNRVVLLVDSGRGGSITLDINSIIIGGYSDKLADDLENLQFIDANGGTKLFNFKNWLAVNVNRLSNTPIGLLNAGVELSEYTLTAGGIEAIAYAQTGDFFANATIGNDVGVNQVFSTSGDDLLVAGNTNDIIFGKDGNDTINGNLGSDLIYGGIGNDVLDGGFGSDTLYGGEGADVLQGGNGDFLYGEFGGDTYMYQIGSGHIVIDDNHSYKKEVFGGGEVTVLTPDSAPNILSFGSGIRFEDLRFTEQQGDLVISFVGRANDQIILKGYDAQLTTKTRSIDVFKFADGTEVKNGFINIPGYNRNILDAQNGVIYGSQFSDTLVGRDGNDTLMGAGGSDTLIGERGSDFYSIYKPYESDSIQVTIGETWNKTDVNRIDITGDVNSDQLSLEFDGKDLLLHFTDKGDVIRFAGVDPRISPLRAPISDVSLSQLGITVSFDQLVARGIRYEGQLNDIYQINKGDGKVIINDIAVAYADNIVRFGQGIDPKNILGKMSYEENPAGGYFLRVNYGNEGDVLLLSGFNPDDALGGTRAVENFEFASGLKLNYEEFVSPGFEIHDNNASNFVKGTNLFDTIYGGQGNDTLSGGLSGDCYVLNKGDGQDIIVEKEDDNFNYIKFGAGISEGDLVYQRDNNALIIRYTINDSVKIEDYYLSKTTPAIVALVFDDGKVISVGNQTNHAPISNGNIADMQVVENKDFSYTLPATLFSDADAIDRLQVSIKLANGEPLPEWLTFDANTGVLSGRPPQLEVGSIALMAEGKDYFGKSAAIEFNLSVQEANQSPTIGTTLSNKTIKVGSAFNFALPITAFVDQDIGDTLTYSATLDNGNSLPSWLTFDAATQSFSGKATSSGSYKVKVTATDLAGANINQIFAINTENKAPTKSIKVQSFSIGGEIITDIVVDSTSDDTSVVDEPINTPQTNSTSSILKSAKSAAPFEVASYSVENAEADNKKLMEFFNGLSKQLKTNSNSSEDTNSKDNVLPPLDPKWFEQSNQQLFSDQQLVNSSSSSDIERTWVNMTDALNKLDVERQNSALWSHVNQGANVSLLSSVTQSVNQGVTQLPSLAVGGTQLKVFEGLKEGIGKLPW